VSSTPNSSTELHEITGLGRPIDIKARSNQIAIIGTALAGLAALLLAWVGGDSLDLIEIARVAAGTFLGWALVREIDPDSNGAAAAAMLVAGAIGLYAPPAALVIGVLLLAVRILTGTVGTKLQTLDLVVLIVAAAYAGTQPVAWPIVALLEYAVLQSGHRWRVPTAVTMGLAASAAALVFVTELAPGSPGAGTWILLTLLALTSWRKIRSPQANARADDGSRIEPSGVGLARLTTLTAIAAGTVMAPETALADLGPAVAALAAMALWPRRVVVLAGTVDEPVTGQEASAPEAA
jgi:hypothetical protein